MPRKKPIVVEDTKEEDVKEEVIQVKPKKERKKKDTIVQVEMKEQPAEKSKPKRKPKVVEPPAPTMIESVEEEPIKVSTVHKVCFERFTHGGKFYYLDKERDKLYEYLGSKKHGAYIGRWDSHLGEIIRDTEDSDED